jgi:hypothetical protein
MLGFSGDPNQFLIRTRTSAKYGGDVDPAGPSLCAFRQIVKGLRRYEQDGSARIDTFDSGLVDFWYGISQ